jgi:glycosyltransferase involved in cell wall biosynthesis
MRIAYLCTDPGVPYAGTKGASVHVTELIGALAGEGAEVLALVSDVAGEAQLPPPGVVIEVLPGSRDRRGAAARVAEEPARRQRIQERLEDFGAEVLYERLALHSAAGSAAASQIGVPHVVELNAPLLEEAGRYRALEQRADAERLERATLMGADLVLAVSSPLAAYARGRGARRTEVLPNAVAIERPPERRPVERKEPVAVFAGRVRPWHGMETVVAAWRMLGDTAPHLLVVGEPGSARTILDSVGAELTGTIPHAQVPAILAKADIGLAPYAADAPEYFSPLKLFEYMAAGLAVVASDLPAVRDAVSERTAVLVPKGDPQALAAAVATLSVDFDRRRRLGEAGRVLVAAEHTWAHRARRVLAAAARAREATDRCLVMT